MLTELSIDEYNQLLMKLPNRGNIYHSFRSKKEVRLICHRLKLEEQIIKPKTFSHQTQKETSIGILPYHTLRILTDNSQLVLKLQQISEVT